MANFIPLIMVDVITTKYTKLAMWKNTTMLEQREMQKSFSKAFG